MKISVVIPFYQEESNVSTVLGEVFECLPEAEIIAVDDGSADNTKQMIQRHSGPRLRLISFPLRLGQSAAIYAGIMEAREKISAIMDGDGQNNPADIPKMADLMDRADVVCGYRENRKDDWVVRQASRFANRIRRVALRDGIRDTGCALKVFRTIDRRFLVPFDGLHRFLPALFQNAGLRVIQTPARHRPRHAGRSKYTVAGRAWRGVHDLLGVHWLLKRQIRWPVSVEPCENWTTPRITPTPTPNLMAS